jgi:hypothetical protein
MTKRARFWGFYGLSSSPLPSDLLKTQKRPRCAELAFGSGSVLGLRFPVQRIFIFGGRIFRYFKCRTKLPELSGSGPVAGVYKWLLTPADGRFGAFWGVLWLKIR